MTSKSIFASIGIVLFLQIQVKAQHAPGLDMNTERLQQKLKAKALWSAPDSLQGSEHDMLKSLLTDRNRLQDLSALKAGHMPVYKPETGMINMPGAFPYDPKLQQVKEPGAIPNPLFK